VAGVWAWTEPDIPTVNASSEKANPQDPHRVLTLAITTPLIPVSASCEVYILPGG
jgi:hypothetical protein